MIVRLAIQLDVKFKDPHRIAASRNYRFVLDPVGGNCGDGDRIQGRRGRSPSPRSIYIERDVASDGRFLVVGCDVSARQDRYVRVYQNFLQEIENAAPVGVVIVFLQRQHKRF